MNISIPNRYQENHSICTAKEKGFENWRNFGVYEGVTDFGQHTVSTRWVITEKVADGQIILKARLVARGLEEDDEIQADSPTARKETLRIFLAITSLLSWQCQTLDIEAAFVQGQEINREVKPPKEVDAVGCVWRLKKCVHGLTDTSREWYFSVQSLLLGQSCLQSS